MDRVREVKSLLEAALQDKDEDGLKEAVTALGDVTMTVDILRATKIQSVLKQVREALKPTKSPLLPDVRKVIKRYNKLQKNFEKAVEKKGAPSRSPSASSAGGSGERHATVLRLKRSDGTDDLTVVDSTTQGLSPGNTDAARTTPFTQPELERFGEAVPPEASTEHSTWTPQRRWQHVDGTLGPGSRWYPWTARIPVRKAKGSQVIMGPYVVPR
ncbi:hypothetical protein PTSG_01076 [Salpingoeca rosetta]|uniref:Uncharacterized protein n=1 Tax=Salpingoeca rosetta (strain ATCC 50818 / BSB-021) TaxID=946362 RepID=F2TYB6_SALR5|nr:uncharacterized protein PTSG_01076 [Salpingoeca rosetta]EGD76375.1 hypothetical protein PTSG_01076 [Salpingoeca rosetta]|eukprot:XP_004998550.1 hypothetical protein PTSG_01076 [Salpingoeca rosetta]